MSNEMETLEDRIAEAVLPMVAKKLGVRIVPPAPMTVSEFGEAANMSATNVYAMIESGALDLVPNSARKMIPHRELVRICEGREKFNN